MKSFTYKCSTVETCSKAFSSMNAILFPVRCLKKKKDLIYFTGVNIETLHVFITCSVTKEVTSTSEGKFHINVSDVRQCVMRGAKK